jgi:putative transposase
LPQARDQQRDILQVEAKYGGLNVSDAKRLKSLEDENAKLKKLLAEAMLDNAMLKDIAEKNGDARHQARGRCSPSGCVSAQRAAGVFDARSGSQLGPVPWQPAG